MEENLIQPISQRGALRATPTSTAGLVKAEGQEGTARTAPGLIEYWDLLRRRAGLLTAFTLIGLVAAICLTLPKTPRYRARMALEIQDINGDFLNTKRVNPVTEETGSFGTMTEVQTQMKILQSDNLVDRVVAKLRAGRERHLESKPASWLTDVRAFFHPGLKEPTDADYLLKQDIIDNLTVRQMGQTRMVEVLFNSTDPQFAADFVNMLASEYIQSSMEARWKMSEHTEQWLGKQLDDSRSRLRSAESELQRYAAQSGLLFTTPANGNSEQVNVVEEKLRQVQQELSTSQAQLATAQANYQVAQSAPPESLGEVLNDQTLQDLQVKLTDLRRQEADLTAIYTAKHEKVRRVQAQIAPLQAAFDRERAAILGKINNDYRAALGREKLIGARYQTQSHLLTDQAGKAIQYNILRREVDSNRQLYESMLQQVKEASVAATMRASNIRVVDPAKVPFRPFSPDIRTGGLFGLLVGLCLGIGYILFKERVDTTLQEPGDAQFWTNLPELGVVPNAAIDNERRALGSKQGLVADALLRLPSSASSELSADSIGLITLNCKPGLVAESFRSVLASVLVGTETGTSPQVIVLTSPGPSEGKTTVVSNLALAVAEIRQRVLVIDADMRRPRLHKIFKLDNARGLNDLLQSSYFDRNELNAAILPTSVPNLHVLTSGAVSDAPADLLYSPRLSEILEYCRGVFDLVLIDTPPTLQLTDARVIGRLADAVILVARVGHTTRDATIAAHRRLVDDRIPVLGTILNDWNPKRSSKSLYVYGTTKPFEYAADRAS